MNSPASAYRNLIALFPDPTVDIGEVMSVNSDGCIVRLLNGDSIAVKGSAITGSTVYVQNGSILGPAPIHETVEIEI